VAPAATRMRFAWDSRLWCVGPPMNASERSVGKELDGVPCRALAEDTTQDIFLRIWRALPGFAGQSQLSTWIYAISKNACLSELRKRRPLVSIDTDEDEQSAEVRALATEDADDSATVSVGQLLDQLPERYRQAVVLFYMEDKSYEQTAESLGLPLGTVKALLHRARKRLIELTKEAA